MCTISVIVPVYNAEAFLHRCIDSILSQAYTDFELILIDDGSKDKSGEICDEYVQKYARVRVFHKENGGVSSARNLGLDNAKGEWITFVDSDDYIEPYFLQSFEGNLDADLIMGNMVETGERGNLLKTIPVGYYNSIKPIISGNLTRLAFQSTWGKLFKVSLLRDLRFDEKMCIGEDIPFVLSYLCRAKDIRVLVECKVPSRYIYISPESMDVKYQISVLSSIYHILRLEKSYQAIGVFDREFEVFLAQAYYERCVNDMPMHGEIWYKNKEVQRICLRRSAHLGFIPWIKTWLSYHVLYRLKIRLAKKHAYLRM